MDSTHLLCFFEKGSWLPLRSTTTLDSTFSTNPPSSLPKWCAADLCLWTEKITSPIQKELFVAQRDVRNTTGVLYTCKDTNADAVPVGVFTSLEGLSFVTMCDDLSTVYCLKPSSDTEE